MSQSNKQIEITKENIEHISKETGVKEEYIRDSVEKQKADEIFRNSKKELDSGTEDRNLKEDLINTARFVGRCFYITPTVPIFGTIINVNTSESSDTIILEVGVEYPDLDDGGKNKKSVFDSKSHKNFRFRMDNKKNVEMMREILDLNNVSKPSELENCKIPIRSNSYNLNYGMSEFGFNKDIPHSNMTLKQKTGRLIQRTLIRLNCFERASSYKGVNSHGDFELNKNPLLYLSLITFLATSLTNWSLFSMMFSTFFGVYFVIVIMNIFYGLSDIFNNNKGDRYYIRQKINK